MKFEKLSENTLKITLAQSELEYCGIMPKDITDNSHKAKEFLCRLILLGSYECNFNPIGDKYTVEVFSVKDCCIVYISAIQLKKHICRKWIVCKIETLEDAALLCKGLQHAKKYILQSALYADKNEYILAIKCSAQVCANIKNILCEFGSIRELSELEMMSISERTDMILHKNALENMQKYFKT